MRIRAEGATVTQAIRRWGLSVVVLAATSSGCAALTSAKGNADSVKGAADDAKSQKDSTTQAVQDETAK